MAHPETANGRSQSVERSQGFLAPLSRSVTEATEQCLYDLLEERSEQGEKEGITERDHQQQFLSPLKTQKTWTFHRQLTLVVAKRHLNLPSSQGHSVFCMPKSASAASGRTAW
jgi:hypothetical protein